MPLDFPNTPSTNDTYSAGGRTWYYNGTTWVLSAYVGVVPPGSVTSTELANNAVTTAKIASGAVEDTDLANAAVTSDKIANSAVTNIKLANTSVTVGSTAITLGSSSTTLAGLTSTTTANANVSTLLTVTTVAEPVTISATAATGTINIDYLSSPTVYYTSNASANFTINIRGNSTTTLNNTLSTGQVGTISFMSTNGSTAYFANVVQIDGSTITPKWQGGTAPSSGNVNSIDAYTVSVVKTAANTYTAFASQTKFA